MSEQVRAELKKASARAMQAKMDLHDLSEDLPVNWPKILEVAQRAHDAFAELERMRAAVAAQESA